MRTKTIAILGAFGVGNFGNDASLQAALLAVRERLPEWRIVCICSNPKLVKAEYELATLPLHLNSPESSRTTSSSRALRILSRLGREVPRSLFAFRRALECDILLVAGTGILDDQHSRPGGPAYDLLLWCTAARLARREVAMLSVGAGPISSALNRRLILAAARAAHFLSYRDDRSRTFMSSLGRDVSRDRICPDLVLGMPAEASPREPGTPPSVAIGVMGSVNWSGRPELYRRYIERLSIVIEELLHDGLGITLVIGDRADEDARAVLLEALRARPDLDARRVCSPSLQSYDDVSAAIRTCSAMIASRYHNLAAALALEMPAVSLEYGFKNSALMSTFGLPQYAYGIDSFSPQEVVEAVRTLLRSGRAPEIAEALVNCRRQVRSQYDQVLGPGPHQRRRTR